MMFVPSTWFPAGPDAEQHWLNVLRYCGQEYAAQQQADYTCQAFISLMFPMQGDVQPADRQRNANSAELLAMINDMEQYRIIQSAWTGSFALLVHGDNHVYVPASCRRPLIQAAHAAMHEGMGSTRHLLESGF